MWKEKKKDGLIWYTLPQWEEKGARIIMTCRPGGESKAPYNGLDLGLHVGDDPVAVVANRRRLLNAIGGSEADFVSVKQVHGKNVLFADSSYRGRGFSSYDDAVDDTDAMFTTEKQVLMATFYADCLPVAVFHPEKKILGLAHAGWKGTYQNIASELISAMREKDDFDISELWCALGAGIGPCCYEVDKDFYDRFCERYEEGGQWFRKEGEKLFFDNQKANLALLKKIGVKEENIAVLSLCTSCRNDLFFSYRKEQGKTGRHGLWGELI